MTNDNMSITSCEVIVLANNPKGAIQPDTFRVEVQALPALQDGEVLIKVIALGNLPGKSAQDPADPAD